jgi:hypothetical protein
MGYDIEDIVNAFFKKRPTEKELDDIETLLDSNYYRGQISMDIAKRRMKFWEAEHVNKGANNP